MIKREQHSIKILPDGWPEYGLLRVDQIVGLGHLPISKSQFWILVRERNLTPVRVSSRVTCFYVAELREKLLGTLGPSTTRPPNAPYEPPLSPARGGTQRASKLPSSNITEMENDYDV
jgi:hypothetical protein